MSKNLFLKIKNKVALGPRTQAEACVRGPKQAYASTLPCTQLGFQKHEKDKFSAIMAEVQNESHIVWELFQTPFCHYIKPYMVHSQSTQKSHEKNTRFTRKQLNKRRFLQNTLKSILFDQDLLWPQSFQFNIVNHSLIGL